MSRLFNNVSKHKGKKHICLYCLNHFGSESILTNHQTKCKNINFQKVTFPMENSKESTLSFSDYHKQLPLPFTIYADMECIIKPLTSNNIDNGNMEKFQEHIPCSFAYKVVCHTNPDLSKPVTLYRGENVIKNLVDNLNKESDYIHNILKFERKPMKLSFQETTIFNNSTICHICELPFINNQVKVRDHCHLTGKFLGLLIKDVI